MPSSDLKLVGVDGSVGRSWMEKSLREGHRIASAVLAAGVFDGGRFLMVAPEDLERSKLDFAVGGVTSTTLAQKALGRFLDSECQRGARCVIVENEFLRSGDPGVDRSPDPTAFVSGCAVHWCDLRRGGRSCAELVNRSSSGFPLNAFVSRRTASELGFEDRKETSKDLPRLIVDDLVAVLVAAFDAESFLIWMPDGENALT